LEQYYFTIHKNISGNYVAQLLIHKCGLVRDEYQLYSVLKFRAIKV